MDSQPWRTLRRSVGRLRCGFAGATKLQRCGLVRTQAAVFAVLASLLALTALLVIDGRRHEGFSSTESSGGGHSPRKRGEMNSSTSCAATRSRAGRQLAPAAPPRAAAAAAAEAAECDMFSGRWVRDEGSHPLYADGDCPYMSDQLACTKHGRPDKEYQRWRWQPNHCDLKRWNATEMMEKLRGKRLMFVGDSLNRGQWISMVCLLQSVIPAGNKSMSPNGPLTIFRAENYNASVEFYWAPLLLESNSDDPVDHRLDYRIINPMSLEKHAAHWEKGDILVFNSYLWWRSGAKIKLMWNLEEGECEEVSGLEAMTVALTKWSNWVDTIADRFKKRVFFVSMSPTHLWSREWDASDGGNCFGEKDPIDVQGYWGSGSDHNTMEMVGKVMSRLGKTVTVLNITQLSEYRKDGHPSIYRKFWETLTTDQLANPASYADCIHWCLPGVPDTWNELLFNLL
ncbi:protein trichome birefringence-like 35 [Wolffia australiana]